MLIIFDLDDTLIDTSLNITPFKLKYTLEKLVHAGLDIQNVAYAHQHFMSVNEQAESSRHALTAFLSQYHAMQFLDLGLEALKDPLPENFVLTASKNALQTLSELKNDHTLALVTSGEEALQKQKLRMAGIQEELFSHVMISSLHDKKTCYENLIGLFNYKPKEILVCGDRVAYDLVPAKALGMYTVHMCQGRGKNNCSPKNVIDYTIFDLSELKTIISRILS